MSKKRPPPETNEAARRFPESTDHTDHIDWATMAPLTSDLKPKDKALTPRPSEALLGDTCLLPGGGVINPFMPNAIRGFRSLVQFRHFPQMAILKTIYLSKC